jgi:hypothetical protein
VLRALLVAFTLEGVLPGVRRPRRRPAPIVRYDRVREPRARTNLLALARRLLGTDPAGAPPSFVDHRHGETRSSSLSTGAVTVLFREA